MNIQSHPSSEIWQMINSGAKVIDVRTEGEFLSGHLDLALNIPHDQLSAKIDLLSVSKETPIVVYCKSGGRSDFAMKVLQSMGYLKVYNGGGYEPLIACKP